MQKRIDELLAQIQENLYFKAKKILEDNTVEVNDWKEFLKAIKEKRLVKTFFCGKVECEDWIKEKTGGATSRCIPFNSKKPKKKCIHCKKDALVEIYFSKNY